MPWPAPSLPSRNAMHRARRGGRCRTQAAVSLVSWTGLVACGLVACSRAPAPPASEFRPGPTPSVKRTTIGELPGIDVDAVLAHTRELSSDRYAGRAPGTNGEELTVSYLTDQFRKLGLRPGAADGGFTQRVPLVGITATGGPLLLRKGNEDRTLA